jgi:hypothetical protein
VQTHEVIKGRRWRVSDPAIPEPLRRELVNELMAARRAVAAGKRAADEVAVATARERVQHAKVALGERGPKWWEARSIPEHRERMEATMLALLTARASGSTICPSDVARAAASPDWREQMDLARAIARDLHEADVVEIRQRGVRVEDLDAIAGAIRIARGPAGVWPE